ncbi:protein adenylyltransferase SelO family protein [Thiolapillus brandeum]|nr:YdiU family protein [Thiolapillus brandeum]
MNSNDLSFRNRFASLGEAFFSRINPEPLPDPYLISLNPGAAGMLGLDRRDLDAALIDCFSGNRVPAGAEPLAMLYAGHQFGHFVPQLGDGRAILLGEVKDTAGSLWELQLKGAGMTPYSRSGDGRAVLRSTIREYLGSEAMHGLGIPTTRALCIVGSDEEVYREQIETAAVLARLAPSHLRFGSFEVFYYRDQYKPLEVLSGYLLKHHFPELKDEPNPHLALFRRAVGLTADLLARWQLVGFSHGVMNTDNMSMLGLTLDYGPFGFLDAYDPGFVCNHSDHEGRYSFDNQPAIGRWNLTCLAQAMLPLFAKEPDAAVEMAGEALDEYEPAFMQRYSAGMRAKLGLSMSKSEDHSLVTDLLKIMENNAADYTRCFRALGGFKVEDQGRSCPAAYEFADREAFYHWGRDYAARLRGEGRGDEARERAMNQVNPKYVLRNYLAQQAIEKAMHRDYSEIDRLLKLLSRPFDEQPENEGYAALPPDWAGAISVSCSS